MLPLCMTNAFSPQSKNYFLFCSLRRVEQPKLTRYALYRYAVDWFVTEPLNSIIVYVARSISDYLTSETGIRIVFESAVVPKWKDSRISFRNVYVSRRPNSTSEEALPRDAGQRAAARLLTGHHPAYHDIAYHDDEEVHGVATGGIHVFSKEEGSTEDGDDGWTTFDLEIDSVDVTLSFARWLEGRGLIKDAAVKGVRGVVGKLIVLRLDCCFNQPSQIVVLYTGIPRSMPIQPRFGIPQSWGILN
jgi:hypothetical protein